MWHDRLQADRRPRHLMTVLIICILIQKYTIMKFFSNHLLYYD